MYRKATRFAYKPPPTTFAHLPAKQPRAAYTRNTVLDLDSVHFSQLVLSTVRYILLLMLTALHFTCLVSGIFLDSSNRRSVIVGAGYIAIEMAGILHTLGSDATLVIRKDKVSWTQFNHVKHKPMNNLFCCITMTNTIVLQVLRTFDSMISAEVTKAAEDSGLKIQRFSQVLQ